MEKKAGQEKNIIYRIFSAIEFTVVFAMAAVFAVAAAIQYIM